MRLITRLNGINLAALTSNQTPNLKVKLSKFLQNVLILQDDARQFFSYQRLLKNQMLLE